ncbi:hypothetical protein ES332_D02G140100v1 [Gossypium tomentosum]|uniref:Uncharacterized protein n=1 Tax=Gossypium tomentosum TaxID=34277 RepID=A0A5D2LWX8_GOSTO|nr:hypothetical protein ES332_D02G140100v1 [Gossypium tomentosum]
MSSNSKQPLNANAELLVDFVSNKMNKAWIGLEKAPEGSFKNKLHGHCFDNHGIRGSPTSTVIGPSKHRHSTLRDPNFVENYFKDRSKWFGELPWEESLRDEHEFGKLVLFQNLDPAYSSAEVEDIVWNAFNETCRAKMVQQTALYFLLPCNVYSHRQV